MNLQGLDNWILSDWKASPHVVHGVLSDTEVICVSLLSVHVHSYVQIPLLDWCASKLRNTIHMIKVKSSCIQIIYYFLEFSRYSYLPIRSPPVSKWDVIHLNHSSKTTYSQVGISPSWTKFSTKQYLWKKPHKIKI